MSDDIIKNAEKLRELTNAELLRENGKLKEDLKKTLGAAEEAVRLGRQILDAVEIARTALKIIRNSTTFLLEEEGGWHIYDEDGNEFLVEKYIDHVLKSIKDKEEEG